MKTQSLTLSKCFIAVSLCATAPVIGSAQIFSGTNLAPSGTAIMGVAPTITDAGTSWNQDGGAAPDVPTALNDGTPANGGSNGTDFETTVINSWNPVDDQPFDYAGILWSSDQNNIAGFRAYFKSFADGGGFETVPEIQTTSDGGSTWSAVSNQAFYDPGTGAEDGYDLLGSNGYGLASFTFDTISGIDGIRMIGNAIGSQNGGVTGAEGFIALTQVEVYAVPEVASFALLVGAFSGFFVFRRRDSRK